MGRVKQAESVEDAQVGFVPLALAVLALGFSAAITWNAIAGQQPAPVLADAPGVVPAAPIRMKYEAQTEEAQHELMALGLYAGPANGVLSDATKEAIAAYQKLNGLPVNGTLTPDLLTQMKFARKVQDASRSTGTIDQAAAPSAPSGPVVYSAAKTAATPDGQLTKKVQVALAGLGYDIKTLDGQLNGETRSAILKFEMDNGLEMGGVVDPALAHALGVN